MKYSTRGFLVFLFVLFFMFIFFIPTKNTFYSPTLVYSCDHSCGNKVQSNSDLYNYLDKVLADKEVVVCIGLRHFTGKIITVFEDYSFTFLLNDGSKIFLFNYRNVDLILSKK